MSTVTIDEAAAIARVSDKTIRRLISENKLNFTVEGRSRQKRVDLHALAAHYPSINDKLPPPMSGPRVIGVCNQKGGVGKTTTTANVAACLAQRGYRVLAVDCDPQASLTRSFGLTPEALTLTIMDVMTEKVAASRVVLTPYAAAPTLSVLPSNIALGLADIESTRWVARETRLKSALAPLLDRYDYILIDCPPHLGVMLTAAAAAATELIIPIQMGPFALYGVVDMMAMITAIRRKVNPDLGEVRALLNEQQSRTRVTQDITSAVHAEFPLVFKTTIRHSVKIPEAQCLSLPITMYLPTHEASEEYNALTEEIMGYGNK